MARRRASVSEKRLKRWAGDFLYPEEIRGLARAPRSKDGLRLFGFASLVKKREGEERGEILVAGPNLIVDLGREAVRELMVVTAEANGADGDKDLGYLAVGRGSGTFTEASTGLFTESTVVSGGTLDQPNRPQLAVTALPPGPPFKTNLFTAQFSAAQLNTAPYNVITEMGLYCLNNTTLFAARMGTAQTKSSGFAIEGRWLISL